MKRLHLYSEMAQWSLKHLSTSPSFWSADPQDKFRSNKNMSMLVRCVTNSHLIINVLNSSMPILTNQPPDFSNMLVVMNLWALLPKCPERAFMVWTSPHTSEHRWKSATSITLLKCTVSIANVFWLRPMSRTQRQIWTDAVCALLNWGAGACVQWRI